MLKKYKFCKTIIAVSAFIMFFGGDLKSIYAQADISEIKDQEVLELLSKSPEPGPKAPKVNAFIVLLDQKNIIKKNGTLITRKHVLVKVLTEEGKKAGDLTIPFNGYFEKLKIHIARTIQPTGEIQNVPKGNIREESIFNDLPAFSDFKNKKVTFPNVQVGSVIEYETEVTENNKFTPGFSFVFMIPPDWLVWRARFSVNVPEAMPVKYKVERFLIDAPLITVVNNSKIYTWQADYVYAKGVEQPSIFNYMRVCPYIAFSTIENWQEINDWGLNLAQNQFIPDAAIEQQVNELVKERKQDKRELIEPIFNFVSKNIKYAPVKLGKSSFKPYPAAEVFKNGYGDCKGKSALLAAMLKSIGISAYPALLITNNSGIVLEDIPMMNFNHMIVAVPDGDGYIFLDPTAELLPFDRLPFFEQGCDAFIIKTDKKEEFVKIPVDSAENNKVSRQCRLAFNGDTPAEVKENYTYTGQLDWPNRVLLKNTPAGQSKEIFEEIASSAFSSFSLKDFSSSDYNDSKIPFSLTSNYTVDNFARKSGNLYYFSLPATDPLLYQMISKISRQTPLNLGFAFVKEEDIVITLPAGYKIKRLPKPFVLDGPLASYVKEIRGAMGMISIYTKWVLKTSEISIDDYGPFKNMIDKIRTSNEEDIIVEEKI